MFDECGTRLHLEDFAGDHFDLPFELSSNRAEIKKNANSPVLTRFEGGLLMPAGD